MHSRSVPVLYPLPDTIPDIRFWSRVKADGECLVWHSKNCKFTINGSDFLAKTLAWILENGHPPKTFLRNYCLNKRCLRHLEEDGPGFTKYAQARFWSKVNKTPTCWEWIGHRFYFGHGAFKLDENVQLASRLSYALANGPIPDGLWVLHGCDNPPCVRPEHLHLGNAQMNMRERADRGRQGPVCLPKGEQHPHAKLTEAAVKEIRGLFAQKQTGDIRKDAAIKRELALAYGVSKETIYLIIRKRIWRCV